jgi:hypothetical protein
MVGMATVEVPTSSTGGQGASEVGMSGVSLLLPALKRNIAIDGGENKNFLRVAL